MSGRRGAKGRFGAKILDGMIEIEIDVPIGLALRLDDDKIARYAGNRLARSIRKRMRAGQDGDGSPLPQPENGNAPARRSGRLLRDIRYDKATGRVKPESRRTRGDIAEREKPNPRVRTSYAVMMVQIASGTWDDPMGSQSPKQRAQLEADINAELAKQLDKGALVASNGKPRAGRRGGRRRR